MRVISKLILWLLVAMLAAIIALYILLQTHRGAAWLTETISNHTDYQLSMEKLEHSFSSPSHLVLKNVTFGRRGQPATVHAQVVDIGLSMRQFADPLHISTLLLQKGTLNLSHGTAALPVKAERLQLAEMAFISPNTGWDLNAQRINGSVTPWMPTAGHVLGTRAQFELSMGSLSLNGIPATRVLIQGRINNESIALTNLKADMARGTLDAAAQRDDRGVWRVEQLRFNNVRLQSAQRLAEFLAPLTTLNALHIAQMEVANARLQGPGWAVTDLNLSASDLTLNNGDWQSKNGKLSINASEAIVGSLHLFEPTMDAGLSPQGVALRKFTARWENGTVSTSGSWQRDAKQLVLNELDFTGLEYTLPENWKSLWMRPLPTWLQSLSVARLALHRNLIIDVNPAFPFQLTGLEGLGSDVQLVKDRQWGIWGGNVNLTANEGTFNRVDVNNATLTLSANAETINVSELDGFVNKGQLDATVMVSQQPERRVMLGLNGHDVPVNVLQAWGWPAISLEGDSTLKLNASAIISANTPLKPSVNATLQVTTANGETLEQVMQQGELVTPAHSATETEGVPETTPEQAPEAAPETAPQTPPAPAAE